MGGHPMRPTFYDQVDRMHRKVILAALKIGVHALQVI